MKTVGINRSNKRIDNDSTMPGKLRITMNYEMEIRWQRMRACKSSQIPPDWIPMGIDMEIYQFSVRFLHSVCVFFSQINGSKQINSKEFG